MKLVSFVILLVDFILGRLAQLVERYPYKVDVTSSSLVATTMIIVFNRRLTKLVSLVKVDFL